LTDNSAEKTNKRNQIIEAAAQVFARSGYSNAVVADIALQANIGKGTIYEYFNSKEDLFFTVFEWFKKKPRRPQWLASLPLGAVQPTA